MEPEPLSKFEEVKAPFPRSGLENPVEATIPSPAPTLLDREAGPGGSWYLEGLQDPQSKPYFRVGYLALEALAPS